MVDTKQVTITYAALDGKISMSVYDFYKLILPVNAEQRGKEKKGKNKWKLR